MSREKKNKLSIYLIRKDVSADGIIVQDSSLINREINGSKLYIRPSATKRPAWINNFFGSALSGEKGIFSSVPSATLIVPVKVETKMLRQFAITFGAGHRLLKKGVFEEHFGLRVVLNAVDEKNIRVIDKTNLGALVKQTREQAARSAETSEFGIDIEQDLVQAVTGLSTDHALGKTISGKDSLHVSVPNTFRNTDELLRLCFRYYSSSGYKTKFPWIDQIEEIRDARKIGKLDAQLIQRINGDKHEKLWMAIPEIIDWADFDCFKYRKSEKAEEYRDLQIPDFIKEHEKNKGEFTIELLKRYEAYCFFGTSPEKSWRIYNCIYIEISEGDRIYTLTNGKWYQINKDFSKDVEKEYSRILSTKSLVSLPNCPTRKEKNAEPILESEYNQYAAKEGHFALLDRKTVIHSGSPIEICDLYSKNKEFIHVKHYGGSSVLSHLFNQGIVSAELFSSHASYRKDMNEKLPADYRVQKPDQPINPQEYKVIFGIISSSKDALEIPFFSKVSLRNSFRRLNLYRYNVYLQKIEVDGRVQLKTDKTTKKKN
jgi:uncharacterized protein (TIGR04141 family)